MKAYVGSVGIASAVVVLFALHAGCGGGVISSGISSSACGADPSCYVTHSNGVCAVDPGATCGPSGAWTCGPGGRLGSGCLPDGGIAPVSIDAGSEAAIIGTCGDYGTSCFAEADGGCVGSPVYPTCVNGELHCPAGTIPQADCPPATGYLACMDAQGTVSGTIKTCQNNNDCVIKVEQTDCCGTRLYVGIQASSAAEFAKCETAWEAHFPGCGCASNKATTEDGKTTLPGSDGGAPLVHCTDFTMSGGVCTTYTP